MTECTNDVRLRWLLPPPRLLVHSFAESLLQYLDLSPGAVILDIACGHGIPAFYLAEQVGSTGHVVAIDLSRHQIERARAIQGVQLPWPLLLKIIVER
jgi:cyclopropane fatty-acyl-phospholipid synthase-like methyltransferase